MALVFVCGALFAGCAPEEPETLSRPENAYVVAQAAVFVNGALYLRERTDGHIHRSLPDGFERVGDVAAVLQDVDSVKEEFTAWNMQAGQAIYASKKDNGCIYVQYPLNAESDCYVQMYRADLYEYWSTGGADD